MTRDDIIKLAREAEQPAVTCWLAYEIDFLERFAALVAAAEREACAKVCEKQDGEHDYVYATGIRARSQQ